MLLYIDKYGNKRTLDSILDLDDGAVHYGESEIESLERKVENLSSAYCELVDILVNNGMLTYGEILSIQRKTSGFHSFVSFTNVDDVS